MGVIIIVIIIIIIIIIKINIIIIIINDCNGMIHKRKIKMSTIRLSQLQYYMANKVERSSEE